MSVTAKDLAKKLHLSEAAVSMALNGKPGVSTATRKRVIETAQQMGYDFSASASLLLPYRYREPLPSLSTEGTVPWSLTPPFSLSSRKALTAPVGNSATI